MITALITAIALFCAFINAALVTCLLLTIYFMVIE